MSTFAGSLLALLLGLVSSCAPAGQATTPTEPRRHSPAPAEALPSSAPTNCADGATRRSERACVVRKNDGAYAQRCVGGNWQDTDLCRCSGPVKVADPALRAKIAKALELDGPLGAEQASVVHALDLRSAGVESLEGLECFDELERLNLDHNRIRDLAPLAGLSKLVELKVPYNQIANLTPLATLPQLARLMLDDNQVRDLSALAQLTQLGELSISNNRARDLSPLARLVGLEKLELSRNRILELSPLESLTNLESLGVGSNCIADLKPIASLRKLRNLNVTFNYVASVAPLGAMTQLEYLALSGNRFTGLSALGNLYELRTLFIDSTGQKDVGALTELMRFELLVIERNPIDCDAQASNIRKLEENAKLHGGRVGHDCTALKRRARQQGLRDPLGLSTPVVSDRVRDERCSAD